MPLMGKQPELAVHMKEVRSKWLPKDKPSAIVVLSTHWESVPIKITSAAMPSMLFDYYGFPDAAYKYNYPAPGRSALAQRIQTLLASKGIESQLDNERGFDHGVFIPLMLMYPEADIPVVCVSLHSSLSPSTNMDAGKALASLRYENILFVGSGYTFHNMDVFRSSPSDSKTARQASGTFNAWLKQAITGGNRIDSLEQWERAPGARVCHPREEHLLPLLVVAALGGNSADAKVIFDHTGTDRFGQGIAVSSYLFD